MGTTTDDMPFIVSTGPPGAKQTDKQTRKLIRSHVMMGKNLGRTLPKRSTKHKAKSQETGSSMSKTDQPTLPEEPKNTKKRSAKKVPTVAGPNLRTILLGAGIPKKVGTDLSLIRFADATVEHSTVLVVLRCKFP